MLQVVPSLRRAAVLVAAAAAVVLSACGGGGGGGNGAAAVGAVSRSGSGTFAPSSTLANMCSVADHKAWVRSYLDEAYLWAEEVADTDPNAYGTPAAYFSSLLVRSRDRFSASMSVAAANAMQGITASSDPAAAASANPVPLVRTYTTASNRKVGYVLFNEHTRGSQDALITAFTSLKAANVQDLVLDLRYNPGGFLYVAQAAAAMIAPASNDGLVFESVRYSARRSAENAAGTYYFSPTVLFGETTYAAGTALPRLSLPRLYVLTSSYTCSASESIINGLRGIGVQVVLVGDRTCGKPYGFHRMDNCGQAYFPIEFQMFNAQGFGDYASGFPVQCRVLENPATALGATNEPLLSAALTHIQTGSCPVAPSSGSAIAGMALGVMVQAAEPVEVAGPSPFERPGAPAMDSRFFQPGFNGRQLLP